MKFHVAQCVDISRSELKVKSIEIKNSSDVKVSGLIILWLLISVNFLSWQHHGSSLLEETP